MSAPRYRVVWNHELDAHGVADHGCGRDGGSSVVDFGVDPPRWVGTDDAEPEDKILVRDLSWVLDELNALAEEIATLRAEPAAARADIERLRRALGAHGAP